MTNPDIFLSYSHTDRNTVQRFAAAFEAEGLEVWWDNILRSGESFDEKIEQALREAKAVVVLWSKASVASRWVRAEATLADRNKTLVPVMIEACDRPIMFELTHTVDLAHWQGAQDDRAWQALLADVTRLVGKGAAPQTQPIPPLQSVVEPQARRPVASSTAVADKIGVAFFPFADMTGTKDQAAFLEGLTEEVNTLVSRNPQVGLITASSGDPSSVAESLGVDYVLDGSVRGSGGRLRVTVRLMVPRTGEALWTERFDGLALDEFALQEEVAAAIARQVATHILAAEVLRIRALAMDTRTPRDLYLLALALSGDWDHTSLTTAIELVQAALASEPNSPLLHANLGWCYSVIYQSGWSPSPQEMLRLSLEASARALRGAATDSRVLLQYGSAMISFGTDLSATEAMIDRALARDPENSSLLMLSAWVRVCMGKKSALALAVIEECVARDPNASALPYAILAQAICHFQLKAFDLAIPPAKEVCLLRPDYMLAQAFLTAALANSGRLDEARAAWTDMKSKAQVDIILAMMRDPDDRELLRTGLVMAGMAG
jgi:TolB-like protein